MSCLDLASQTRDTILAAFTYTLPLGRKSVSHEQCCARSYFPLYPPAPGSMLDASLGLELDLPCTPDVLILPSDLAPFAKLVAADKPARSGNADTSGTANPSAAAAERLVMGNVVCVNPGRLAKDKSGGTFARLQVMNLCF